jgi:hypothetical protein
MRQVLFVAGLLAVFSVGVRGQEPDGKDIPTAIPVYFGQTITDIGDANAAQYKVYKITLARGQQFTVDAGSTGSDRCCWRLTLWGPAERSIATLPSSGLADSGRLGTANGLKIAYSVPAAGTYYVLLGFSASGVQYTIRFNANGTPITVPNPASAGCLTGRVDSMLYSLQRIALGLPDEVTIGGQRACATCTVKPPLYPEVSSRLEGALRSGVGVEACYDSAGSIFQLKLLRQ